MSYYRVCAVPLWTQWSGATVCRAGKPPFFGGGKDKRGRNGKETDKKAAGKAVIH